MERFLARTAIDTPPPACTLDVRFRSRAVPALYRRSGAKYSRGAGHALRPISVVRAVVLEPHVPRDLAATPPRKAGVGAGPVSPGLAPRYSKYSGAGHAAVEVCCVGNVAQPYLAHVVAAVVRFARNVTPAGLDAARDADAPLAVLGFAHRRAARRRRRCLSRLAFLHTV